MPIPRRERTMPEQERPISIAETIALCSETWIKVAQRRYGFDLLTARRLAFACWLRLTGRLSDWGSDGG
jgi:hypothetical protein